VIPRVIGILAIVFCVFGLFGTAIWTYGPIADMHLWDADKTWHAVEIWLYVWCVLGVVVFGLHLAGGILAVAYRPSAPRMVSLYALLALAVAVADVVIVIVLAPSSSHRHHDLWFSVGTMHIVYTAMAIPWPVIALALINRPAAKAACAGADPASLERVFS
jgi:hypothetical protein